MGKNLKIKYCAVLITILSFIILNISKISYAQDNSGTLLISTNLEFFEFSEIKGEKMNISSIHIELPEPNWTVSNIQVNISDISLGSEIKIIEDSETTSELVWNKNPPTRTLGLGTQIEILEVTELFGVYIKGYKTPEATETIKFQLHGFDEYNHKPNNTIYRSIDLNISTNLDWYYQDFSLDPITLQVGNYSLVMNGTDLLENQYARYYWQKNDVDPQIQNLYTSSYILTWNSGTVNSSFLCKLNQTVDENYLPTDLNMTVEFDGKDYLIPASGFLEIANITYFSEEIDLYIPFTINKSVNLNFNFNSTIALTNEFSTISLVQIKELNNEWSLSPSFNRISQNYFVEFNFPKNWYNFTVNRKIGSTWENVTSLIDINPINRILTIPNNTILVGSEWRIIAYSPNVGLNMNFPKTEFGPGQEIQFSISAPIPPRNITFRLINPLGFTAQSDATYTIESTRLEDLIISYQLPSNPYEGIYKAYIFWNNQTTAGVVSQEFLITVPFVLDPMLIIIIVGVVAGISIVSFTSYKLAKNSKRKHEEHRQKIFNKYVDVLNLEYFIIIHKKSGLNVYEQMLTAKTIDASLITGFLEAIRTFGIELTGSGQQSQTIKLEYQQSKVLMSEFKNFRILLIMKESPSHDFLESIKALSYDIDNRYGNLLENFRGNIDQFVGIRDLLELHLQTSLIYPLQIVKKDVKLNSYEKSMVHRAKTMMKKKNMDYFTVTNLLSVRKEFDASDAETILHLIKKKIFQPKT